MSFLRVSVAFLLGLTTATSALAQDAQSAGADAKPVKQHKMCRREVDTGSIMPHSTCHTKEEWQTIDAANQEQANRASNDRRNLSPALNRGR